MAVLLPALLSGLLAGSGALMIREVAGPVPSSTDFWPTARGAPASYTTSPFEGPKNLSASLAWSWHNVPNRYEIGAPNGLVIDDKKNVYMAATDSIRKFSPEGKFLWIHRIVSWRLPVLANGLLYSTDNSGNAVALDKETGELQWRVNFTTGLGPDISGLALEDGILIGTGEGNSGGGSKTVCGLNASTGAKLWEFGSDAQLWNFMPMLTGKGTFVFQDQLGGVYHADVKSGARLWKSGYQGGWQETFTDGMASIGPNDVVYAVHMNGPVVLLGPKTPGTLRAYALSDGGLKWEKELPYPPNSMPAVGRIGKGQGLNDRLSVVISFGAQPFGLPFYDEFPSEVRALDAETGELQWSYEFPLYHGRLVAGDAVRLSKGSGPCLPNPFANPTVDSRGTLYIGHLNGNVYAIRDENGDGQIEDSEVQSYDTGAGFSHGGAGFAPGMMAIASCDGLFTFKS